MPEFEIVPLREAQARTVFAGRRGRILQEYINYIQHLKPGQAGRLRAVGDEKISTVRRRIAQVAQALGTDLVIKRSGDEVYFWVESPEGRRPRRGRRGGGQSREPESGK